MKICFICGDKIKKPKWMVIPKQVIVDKQNQPRDIIREKKVPVCYKHNDEINYDISVSYFTNRIYKDGRKRLIFKFLAPLCNKKDVSNEKAKEIVSEWLEKNYNKYPPNSDEKVYSIINWAKGVVDWAYRNNRNPSFKALKGLSYEVDTDE